MEVRHAPSDAHVREQLLQALYGRSKVGVNGGRLRSRRYAGYCRRNLLIAREGQLLGRDFWLD